MNPPRNKRVLLLLPGAFGPAGGLEMYDRLVIKGFHEIVKELGGECEVQVLLDQDAQLDARYLDPSFPRPRAFAASRPRFIAAALERALLFRPDLVVFGHINFGPLALAIRAILPFAAQWFIVYGIDVWRHLRPAHGLAARTAEKILSISDYTRVELCRFNGVATEKVGLLPCALDPFWSADFAALAGKGAAPDPARPLLLTVARLADSERYKGIDQVIRALPAIARAIPGVRYAVIGQGADRARLEGIAREAGVAERVEFRGRVSTEALAQAYAECALFAMPSAKEGFGIVFLEAALFSKPSIGGAHGGTPEVIDDGHTGKLVEHADHVGFAGIAIDLLKSPERLHEMGENARARLQKLFTYPTFLRTLREHVLAG